MHLVIIIAAIVISETFAQYYIKQYHEIPSKYYYMMGIGFYTLVVYFLNKSYDYTTMGMAQVLWSGLSCISILMVGRIFFGEKVDANEWIGMTLILLGVIITQLKKNMWLTKELNKEVKTIFNYTF
tara:strand:- start:105 stop:482 length:378 start_codon:yes stop_codon:yes gene_type:complete